MTETEKILQSLSDADQQKVKKLLEAEREKWVGELKPKADEFGRRRLPRINPDDLNSPFLKVFKTDKHTYTNIAENGLGFERFTAIQKRSIALGAARSFSDLVKEYRALQQYVGGERNTGALVSNTILRIQGLIDSVADFGQEQYHHTLHTCSCFLLREDEDTTVLNEALQEEKIKDWLEYGYVEIDFFLLAGSIVSGYAEIFNETVKKNKEVRARFVTALSLEGGNTDGKLSEKKKAEG